MRVLRVPPKREGSLLQRPRSPSKRDRLDCQLIGRFRNAFQASSPDFPNGDLLRRLIP